jgi:hypothetical protein
MAAPSIIVLQEISVACRNVQEAIKLEENYREMLFQGEEVDQRIELWRYAIASCEMDSACRSCV